MNILDLIRTVRTPDQLKRMALQGIQRSNPDIANVLSDCLNRGEPPKQILSEAIQAGKINHRQFTQFREAMSKYSRFLPFGISASEMDDLESAFGQEGGNGFRF